MPLNLRGPPADRPGVVLLTLVGTLWVCVLVVVLALCRAAAVGDGVEDPDADLCGSPH